MVRGPTPAPSRRLGFSLPRESIILLPFMKELPAMRSPRRWIIILALLILAFLLIAPSRGVLLRAQTLERTPTSQLLNQEGAGVWGLDMGVATGLPEYSQ